MSPSLVLRVSNRILPKVREWQSRTLKRLYAMVYMDAIHYHVDKEDMVVNKVVYITIGMDMNGRCFRPIYRGSRDDMNELKN